MKGVDVKRPLGMLVPMLFSALAVQAVPLKIVNPSFEEAEGGRCAGWELSPGMRQGRSAGHNGSGGLVWESSSPNAKQDFARQIVPLEAGKAYNFSVLVRTEGFKSKKYGATMCIEWHDANGKWMAGAYAHGVTNPDEDWTLVKSVTREIPAEAASVTAMIFITSGCAGKAYFDNVTIEPVDREPVAFVFSSAYRNVAVEGPVRFHASLYRPEDLKDTRAVFVRRDAAGAERRDEPTEESADGATLALDVADLPMGRSEVACELLSKDGRLLGRAVCPFERVTALPERHVWIDAHKRCIVDGQPFFPLGMYTSKIDDEMLDRYCEGPFNVVMPYATTTCRELDLLQARGIRGCISLRSQLLGTDWAKRNNITRQEQVDAFYETEINKSKHHPALLGWYVCDERPATEIPDRTHLHGVFVRTDPDHPTWAVLDRTYDLREFIPTFDVLGMDPYPIGRKPLKHVTELVRETQKAVFGDVALWNVPQTFDWGWFRKEQGEKGLRFPTEAEIANMNWQHIALGANGLVAYNFHSLKRDCDPKDAPEFWGRICRAFEPVRKMIPVMLSVDPAPGIDNAPEMMPVRTWMKDGELYVLAVNPLAEIQAAKLFVGGGDWTLAGVEVGAAEKAEVAGNRIDLTLAPTGFAMLRLRRVTSAPVKAVLLHLGYNMWHPADTVLRARDDLWRKATDAAVAHGLNMVVIDVGEGVVLPSHPELAIKGSWSVEKLKAEIARLRAAGLEVVPKLNFSATHDAWLGPYARRVSTPEYYAVVKDVIGDVAEIFGHPRLFHLGWDEETAGHQRKHDYIVVRGSELWWHDFLYTVKCCEDAGCRPWVWSDYGWHHPDYVTRCPRSVMQSNWYYDESCEGFDLSDPKMKASADYLRLYLTLDRAGFDQIPCGTNWVSGFRRSKGLKADGVIGKLVDFSRRNVAPERLKGFLMASWAGLDSEENLAKTVSGIELFAAACGDSGR